MHLLYIYKKTPPPKNKMNKCTMCVCVCTLFRESGSWGWSYSHLSLLFPNVPLQTLC